MTAQTTPPDSQDPSAGTAPFGGLGAGFDFFQQWMKAASSALPNMGSAATQGATAWAVPTLDPQELDKRIQELKTVQFWLEQNARMLGMTIQTLEVQRMTLETLHGMKVPMEALRESMMAQAPFAGAAAASAATTGDTASEPSGMEGQAAVPNAAAAVNPMQWWNNLAQQFTALASQAVQPGQDGQAGASSAAGGGSTPDAARTSASAAQPAGSAAKAKPGATPSSPGSSPGKPPKR